MNFLAGLFGNLGEFIAKNTSGACLISWLDEEEMPEELL